MFQTILLAVAFFLICPAMAKAIDSAEVSGDTEIFERTVKAYKLTYVKSEEQMVVANDSPGGNRDIVISFNLGPHLIFARFREQKFCGLTVCVSNETASADTRQVYRVREILEDWFDSRYKQRGGERMKSVLFEGESYTMVSIGAFAIPAESTGSFEFGATTMEKLREVLNSRTLTHPIEESNAQKTIDIPIGVGGLEVPPEENREDVEVRAVCRYDENSIQVKSAKPLGTLKRSFLDAGDNLVWTDEILSNDSQPGMKTSAKLKEAFRFKVATPAGSKPEGDVYFWRTEITAETPAQKTHYRIDLAGRSRTEKDNVRVLSGSRTLLLGPVYKKVKK